MSLTFNGLNGLSFGDGTSQNTAASGFGFKNRIINGDMRIDQRNVGASSVNTHASYPVDRFQITNQMDSGVYTAQRSSDVPSGLFNNSIVCTVTTAQASIGTTSNYASIRQKIEGYNIQGFGQGTSAATSMALSFWVKASQTGTWCVQLTNNNTQYYVATYEINTANTWQKITIIIPPNTASSWNTTNGIGLQLWWTLACGSDFQTSTANTWVTSATSLMKTSAQNNFFATNGNTFYITGVQLEKGSTVTAYDYRPYNIEDVLCKRYFEKSYDFNATIGSFSAGWRGTSTNGTVFAEGPGWPFSVVKRTIPTVVFYNAVSGASGRSYQVSTAASIAVSARYIGTTGIGIIDYTSSGGQNSYYIHYTADAEL